MESENKEKIEGIGGWLYVYFFFWVDVLLFLSGFLIGTYDSLVSGTESIRSIVFFLAGALQVILVIVSANLLFDKKKATRFWSIMSLAVCFLLFLGLLISNIGSETFTSIAKYLVAFLIGSLIWIFYFLTSERVKNTFVK